MPRNSESRFSGIFWTSLDQRYACSPRPTRSPRSDGLQPFSSRPRASAIASIPSPSIARFCGLGEFLARSVAAARLRLLALRSCARMGPKTSPTLPPVVGHRTVALSPAAERDLVWWVSSAQILAGRDLFAPASSGTTILSDASSHARAGAILLESRDIDAPAVSELSIPWVDVHQIQRTLEPFSSPEAVSLDHPSRS